MLLLLSDSIRSEMHCNPQDIHVLQNSWNLILATSLKELNYSTVRVFLIDKRGYLWHDILLPVGPDYFTSLHWEKFLHEGVPPPLNKDDIFLTKTAIGLAKDSNTRTSMAIAKSNAHNNYEKVAESIRKKFYGISLLCIADLRPESRIGAITNTFMFYHNIGEISTTSDVIGLELSRAYASTIFIHDPTS